MARLDILNGLVSKIINDCWDITIDAIKEADKNRKSSKQNIQTRIYQVIVDSLNYFTYNQYKRQDKLYDASESILKEFKSGKDNADAVESGLKMLVPDVNNDTCQDLLETLCREICRNENSDLYKEIDMLWKRQESKYIHGEFERSNQNHEKTHKKLDYVIEKIDGKGEQDEERHSKPYIENRADEYAQKWDKNVFLNNFNKRDKKAGVNIRLSQLYLDKHLPHYIWGTNDEEESDIEQLLREYIVDNDDKKMLLILGQPGIGKSTLITWIMANFIDKKDDIYVYQFASDLKDIDWQGDDILDNIFEALGLIDKLENKVLIIDGFDEIHANSGRERILNQIYHRLNGMNYLKHFSLIITCRKNYIHELQRVVCNYITLLAWDKEQISSFCENYGKVSKKVISQNTINNLISNREILGIPLILYMVLALDISVGEGNSLGDIYDKIFSLDGGIYDRCINNLSYGEEHRISGIKRQIHQISQRIAFWMFENEPDEAFITKDKYEEICDGIINETSEENEDIKRNVLISNYFEPIKHCEGIGTDELQFVHRSIYEYFVAVYFYESIYKLASKEIVAGKLGELLKDGRLSKNIREFVKYKFDKMKGFNLSNIIGEVFDIMIKDGMIYYAKEKYKNIIEREMNIFLNMLEVVHLWKPFSVNSKIVTYLRYNNRRQLNLKEVKLQNVKLNDAYLENANLEGADIKGIDLMRANLADTNLSNANLEEANLRSTFLARANLAGTNLSKAYLVKANLTAADLSETNLKKANLTQAKLENVDLVKADLEGANLENVNLVGANLEGANLENVNLEVANLTAANLEKANLKGANLSGANLTGVILKRANLSGACFAELRNLVGANLEETDLTCADLSRAYLIGADLSNINLEECKLEETIFDEEQVNLLCEKYDIYKSRVYIGETEEIISYEEYCIRKTKQ